MRETYTRDGRTYRRCEGCSGMGYKGRWRPSMKGPVWKIETHRPCGGSGEIEVRPK